MVVDIINYDETEKLYVPSWELNPDLKLLSKKGSYYVRCELKRAQEAEKMSYEEFKINMSRAKDQLIRNPFLKDCYIEIRTKMSLTKYSNRQELINILINNIFDSESVSYAILYAYGMSLINLNLAERRVELLKDCLADTLLKEEIMKTKQ